MLNLHGKVVLITGLGQTTDEGWGIGAAIATLFARQGAAIFGGNRSLTSANRTKARIEEEGGICHVVETDVTDSASVKALVDQCIQRHGRIDILVNNVGRSEPGCPASMTEDTWHAQVDINLNSLYLLTHHVLPIMTQQGHGSVVSVASIAGLRYIGKPQVAYSATKAAMIQFAKATAVMYARQNIRLNTVVPGLIYTPYTEALAQRYAPGKIQRGICRLGKSRFLWGEWGMDGMWHGRRCSLRRMRRVILQGSLWWWMGGSLVLLGEYN
ncbi:hypothetical protein N7450_009423 [Penicillium hetheringtonii]|uniref:Uncharacterized protein n=1 Tax=Penicillium hetheringtonii TaxID=911720 RepID=A0AAD6DB90_9EURO|nr:hypothetical protein N7450_009423 [Penicillium hetheringtonii]